MIEKKYLLKYNYRKTTIMMQTVLKNFHIKKKEIVIIIILNHF